MNYKIYIGNAELVSEWDGDHASRAEWIVKLRHDPASPKRAPNYLDTSCGVLQDFACRHRMLDLFYNETDGLLYQHPGIRPLKRSHLRVFEAALAIHRRNVPKEPSNDTWDMDIRILEWLVWWTHWALGICHKPAIYNT